MCNRNINPPSQRASLIKLSFKTRLNPKVEGGIHHSLSIDTGLLVSFLGARPWVLITQSQEVGRGNEESPMGRDQT